jgi:hypothetical protein
MQKPPQSTGDSGPERIRRHDEVVAEIRNKVRDVNYMNIIYEEQTFTSDAG